MTTKNVAVIHARVGNLASVLAGIRRAGGNPILTEDPDVVASSEFAILPGVGSFVAGMLGLEELGLVDVVRERICANKPTLAVCVGMQILFEGSEENPGVEGLGIIPATMKKFDASLRVPQLGWNNIVAQNECRYLNDGYVYFANSYRATEIPLGWKGAMCDYGGPFVAALERGNILACQFHPEISGNVGMQVVRRWLDVEKQPC